ncbi:hypothetical protein F5883DRAFT_178424 [Diaporthe sp. PMI_573]|nr:hypothetical protein F5883DRAFT_178424 [Diaporthaceae sp. PMI_573]
MAQTDANTDREVTLFCKGHEPSEHNAEQRHCPRSEINTPKSPQQTLEKALDRLGWLATNKVGKGYDGYGATAVSASDSSSTNTTADLASAGLDPPVTAISAGTRGAGLGALSESSGPATSDGPGDLVLLRQLYKFAGSAEDQKPHVPDTDTSDTTPAAEHVFPEVGGRSPQTPVNMAATAPEPPKLGRKRARPLDFYIPIKLGRAQPPRRETPRTPAPPPLRASTGKRCRANSAPHVRRYTEQDTCNKPQSAPCLPVQSPMLGRLPPLSDPSPIQVPAIGRGA